MTPAWSSTVSGAHPSTAFRPGSLPWQRVGIPEGRPLWLSGEAAGDLRHPCCSQSSGTGSIPHTLPDSFRARPRSQSFSYSPREIQWTTRAATSVLVGRPFRWTIIPVCTGRGERAAHPPRFARMILQGSEKGSRGSRLVRMIGISQGIRVPPRATAFGGVELGFRDSNRK